ncbi:MAG: 2-aminoethylphosphonate--pyruvate transaminase [Planctomycetes bacterium]|nr:2-aminoethylphosphonate--pyruvate transaminase [Planctomycetota bacterium]
MDRPSGKDKPLFTPGPLTTSATVKEAMLSDLGSRDTAFIGAVREIRAGLLLLAGVSQESGWEAVLMQGSGTFSVESVLSSSLPEDGALLVARNGAYGARIASIARCHGVPVVEVVASEGEPVDPAAVEAAIREHPELTHLAVVHCETTSGVLNPVEEVGAIAHAHGLTYFVDSMSAFGAVPIDLEACHVDFLVSSANKCIEGVPGFGFALCRRAALDACEGRARSVSLDLYAQWAGLEANGQFRFTPPTHSLLAFHRALRELDEEGGVAGRQARYQVNHARILDGIKALGLSPYVPEEHQCWIITSVRYPESEAFSFEELYDRLNERGYVIYPGKVTDADCFRIGNIGRLFEEDMDALLVALGEVLREMGVEESIA